MLVAYSVFFLQLQFSHAVERMVQTHWKSKYESQISLSMVCFGSYNSYLQSQSRQRGVWFIDNNLLMTGMMIITTSLRCGGPPHFPTRLYEWEREPEVGKKKVPREDHLRRSFLPTTHAHACNTLAALLLLGCDSIFFLLVAIWIFDIMNRQEALQVLSDLLLISIAPLFEIFPPVQVGSQKLNLYTLAQADLHRLPMISWLSLVVPVT